MTNKNPKPTPAPARSPGALLPFKAIGPAHIAGALACRPKPVPVRRVARVHGTD